MEAAEEISVESGFLTEELLAELTRQLEEFHPTWQTVDFLREKYPQLRFILCSEDDMGDKEAYLSFDDFEIFLMAGSLGCACLTDQIEKSVGVVIATIEED